MIKNNITSKEKEQKVKATMYVQETKGIVTTSLGMICKRSDGTVYLKNADGFMGCASVQDFWKRSVNDTKLFIGCGR